MKKISLSFMSGMVLTVVMSFTAGCGSDWGHKPFYVVSTEQGYKVTISEHSDGSERCYISKGFDKASDAEKLAVKLNEDMKDSWEK